MIFKLTSKEKEKINKLIETKYYNDEVANFLNDNIINNLVNTSDKTEYQIKELNIDEYLNNKYYQIVNIDEYHDNNYQIKYEEYKPNQCFLYDDIEVDEDDYFLIHNKVGYFIKPYKYLTIQKDDVIWMSVIPHEINTMNKCLHNLTSHIYVFGLGLGYYLSLIASKVNKITVLEKDKTIIKLFKEHIEPKLNLKDKLEIINIDAYEYINKINDELIFIDLYHDVNDGLEIYFKMKQLLKNKNVNYWIEDSLIAAIRNLFINLIEEELYHKDEFNYKESKNIYDEIINRLHQYYLNKEINSYSDIKELLKSENLKKIISLI